MLSFREMLNEDCTAVNVSVDNKNTALIKAVDLLSKNGKVLDKQKLLNDILIRESMSSTGIGEGVAFPHTRSESVSGTMFAVLGLSKGVNFEAEDGNPVDIIFIIASPPEETAINLQLLSKLARLLHDPDFRKAIREVQDNKSLAKLLYEKD